MDGFVAAKAAPSDARSAGPRFWRDSLRRRMLGAADVIAAALATTLLAPSLTAAVWAAVIVPVWVVVAKLFGLYDRDQMVIRHLTFDELPRIAAWAASTTALLGALLYLAPVAPLTVGDAIAIWVAMMVLATILRGTARSLWRRITPPELTAILGAGELATAARRKLELFGDMHLRLAPARPGLAALDPLADGDGADRDARLRELAASVDRIIVATEHVDPALIGRLAQICRAEQVKLSVVSPLRGRAGAMPRLSEVADLPVLEYDTRDVPQTTLLLKRAFDLFFATIALILTAPLFPLIAAAIRLDSPGSVFFVQRRAGMRGRSFRMFKFRTMRAGADAMLAELVSIENLTEPAFKFRSDPRVTRVGRLLRRLSVDELPQLLNVLRGDMSIVGPRPEQIDLVARYRPEHRFRLEVKPGMTGPMQVFGRGALSFAERLAVELDYVENLSLSRDLRIICQTLPVIYRGTGAY